MAKSTKIVTGSGDSKKTEAYQVTNKSGGSFIATGGKGKDGYIGRVDAAKKK